MFFFSSESFVTIYSIVFFLHLEKAFSFSGDMQNKAYEIG